MKDPGPVHCGGFWSPIIASGPESTLSGVLAGFVFTAITVILINSPATDDKANERRSYALQMLASAFIIFALDSYLGSLIAGELACSRAYAEIALLGGILADGAALTIAGLGWLILASSVPAKGIERVLSYINWGVWITVIVMLTASAMGTGEALLPGRSHAVVISAPLVLVLPLIIAIIFRARNARSYSELDKNSSKRMSESVRLAALSGLLAAIFGLLFAGIIVRMFGDIWWINPPSAAIRVEAVIVLSVLVPYVPLWVSARPAMAARAVLARTGSQDAARDPTDGGANARSDVDRDSGEDSTPDRSGELGDDSGGAVTASG